jgi:hypothetical protein
MKQIYFLIPIQWTVLVSTIYVIPSELGGALS